MHGVRVWTGVHQASDISPYRTLNELGCLLGRLLARQLPKQQGIATPRFEITDAGKPFLVSPAGDTTLAPDVLSS